MDEQIRKANIKNPFSTYDLFGYLIPGAIALLAVGAFEFWVKLQIGNVSQPVTFHLPFIKAITETARPFFISEDLVLSGIFLIILLVVAYAAGHIVSSLSSISLDRVLIYKGYGYPYQQLLHLEYPKNNWETGPFYRGLFFWINTYLLLRYYTIIYPDVSLDRLVNWVGWYIIAITIIKLIISNTNILPLRWVISHTPYGLKCLTNKFFKIIILKLFAGPYDVFARSLSRVINTRDRFSEEFIASYKNTFYKLFGLDSNKAETNNYWLTKCFVAFKSPALNTMLENWHHLYSYARNLSTAFYLAYIYCFFSIFLQFKEFRVVNDYVIYLIPIIYFILSLIMLKRYYYLYNIYYSKFLFRAFYFLNQPNISKG